MRFRRGQRWRFGAHQVSLGWRFVNRVVAPLQETSGGVRHSTTTPVAGRATRTRLYQCTKCVSILKVMPPPPPSAATKLVEASLRVINGFIRKLSKELNFYSSTQVLYPRGNKHVEVFVALSTAPYAETAKKVELFQWLVPECKLQSVFLR